MSKPVFYLKEPTSSLRVCRGCLATDARLYDMRENRLLEAYTRLVQVTDNLPHYLCSYCAVLLLKCDAFRIKCIDALLIFRNAQLDNVDLHMEHIKRIDRMSNKLTIPYKITPAEFLNIDDVTKETHMFKPKLEINNDYETTSIKEEIDIVDNSANDTKIENDTESATSKNLLSNVVFYPITGLENNYSNNPTLNVFDDSAKVTKTGEELPKTTKKRPHKPKIVNKKKTMNAKDLKEKIETEDTPIDNNSETDLEISYESMKGKRNRYDNLDYEMFSKEFNMDVKLFNTKEEQIENYQQVLKNRKNDTNKRINFKCKLCYKGFFCEGQYMKHMLLHRQRFAKFQCDICNLRLINKFSYVWHKARHIHSFSCRDCDFTTDLPGHASEHRKRHRSKVVCKHCGKPCNALSSYYTHLKLAHPTCDELTRCEMCGDSFCGSMGMKRHEMFAHKQMNSPECLCSRCGIQFYCSAAFKAHQGTDGLCDATHKYCVRCGMAFETEQLLKAHEAEQRKPRDEFQCEVCQKKFPNYPYLAHHRKIHDPKNASKRRKNTNEKKGKQTNPVVLSMCEVCGTIFQNRGLLQLHYRAKHSTEKLFACTECPKKFTLRHPLVSHMRTHTGERPFKCPHCPKAFTSATNRIRHTLVHTGERPFSCNICQKSFQTKDCVKMHIKTVHMNVPLPRRNRNKKKT